MRRPVVIDTNVPIVANGGADHAGPDCVLASIATLENAREHRVILVDDEMRILDAYRDYLNFAGQPGPGDRFFKWLWNNQANKRHCRKIQLPLRDDGSGEFLDFPDDPALAEFDRGDRIFVAVVVASGRKAPIRNASDTDWWEFNAVLARHGVRVEFLCPELMQE